MKKLIILINIILISCYQPTIKDIELSKNIKDEKLNIQDSIFKNK